MKKIMMAAAFALATVFAANAQSAEKLTEILDASEVSLAQLSYIAGTCGFNLPDNSNYTTAFEEMKRRGYFGQNAKESDKATLAQASYLFMKATKIDGGLMYRITDSPRYAFKELKARGIIPQTAEASLKFSGHEALDLLNSCIAESK
nr:hypothetical protein [Treponema sp.]